MVFEERILAGSDVRAIITRSRPCKTSGMPIFRGLKDDEKAYPHSFGPDNTHADPDVLREHGHKRKNRYHVRCNNRRDHWQ
ncbi:hypothetical protein D9M71_603400 [compost metagenome]